jgi:hypothetical protein
MPQLVHRLIVQVIGPGHDSDQVLLSPDGVMTLRLRPTADALSRLPALIVKALEQVAARHWQRQHR